MSCRYGERERDVLGRGGGAVACRSGISGRRGRFGRSKRLPFVGRGGGGGHGRGPWGARWNRDRTRVDSRAAAAAFSVALLWLVGAV